MGELSYQQVLADREEYRDALKRVLVVCAEWDKLTRGESPTTAQIRAAIDGRTP